MYIIVVKKRKSSPVWPYDVSVGYTSPTFHFRVGLSIVWTPPPNNSAEPVFRTWVPPALASRLFADNSMQAGDEDVKVIQERTGQVQPSGHVTELRSHGTPISRLLPDRAEPVKEAGGDTEPIPSLYHARYLLVSYLK
ncbi:hypothetical protein CROQUDRAFT_92390 [Cronartium quercuum f. sp. fusiforme G11]|uniref:Uncharacterized protein n=1 Tax=Cronartium quercuum f. sp. fusiforme G11 TaxID=708437 RepID=A0A9P6TDG7_9BASI|nr:hypothetical protein CROQUDRAFT_92390 [Cronartium quercuum f. sp. fusiforme G11]